MHFDPTQEIVLSSDVSISILDWCSFGTSIGRWIQKTNRVCLADTVKCGKKYSQVEKEGLACVFGVKRLGTLRFSTSTVPAVYVKAS